MKTEINRHSVEVSRGQYSGPSVMGWVRPAGYIDLAVSSEDEESGAVAELTPSEARQLAADLVKLAAEIEGH